jgi:hypothetical protein
MAWPISAVATPAKSTTPPPPRQRGPGARPACPDPARPPQRPPRATAASAQSPPPRSEYRPIGPMAPVASRSPASISDRSATGLKPRPSAVNIAKSAVFRSTAMSIRPPPERREQPGSTVRAEARSDPSKDDRQFQAGKTKARPMSSPPGGWAGSAAGEGSAPPQRTSLSAFRVMPGAARATPDRPRRTTRRPPHRWHQATAAGSAGSAPAARSARPVAPRKRPCG